MRSSRLGEGKSKARANGLSHPVCAQLRRRGCQGCVKHRLPVDDSETVTRNRHTGGPIGDTLFGLIERWQGQRPWGHFLDAGTGKHSLRWATGLPTASLVAITGAPARRQKLVDTHPLRRHDRILCGNWRDPGLLEGEVFDTVLADYLLGAIDGFAPYFQDELFRRLRPHVGGRLYIVGLSPTDRDDTSEAGRFVRQVHELRDACILLAGHRCYREYPLSWVLRSLSGSGFRVVHSERVPIIYRERFVDGQLDVCVRKLPFIDQGLVPGLRGRIEVLRQHGHTLVRRFGGLRVGSDYVVAAEPA